MDNSSAPKGLNTKGGDNRYKFISAGDRIHAAGKDVARRVRAQHEAVAAPDLVSGNETTCHRMGLEISVGLLHVHSYMAVLCGPLFLSSHHSPLSPIHPLSSITCRATAPASSSRNSCGRRSWRPPSLSRPCTGSWLLCASPWPSCCITRQR